MAEKKTKRKGLIAALAVLVVALAVGGTVAWLTAQDALSNTFTVGTFSEPDKEPGTDEGGDQDEDPGTDKADGYLFETNWNIEDNPAGPKLTVGTPEPKNPNVGIGMGSDKAYVFIYVDNKALEDNVTGEDFTAAAPYFTLEHQWDDVVFNGNSQAVASTNTTDTSMPSGAFVSGLFGYVGANGSSGNLATLDASTADVYTGELFETITIPNGVDTRLYKSSGKVDVYAFIYAADEDDPNAELNATRAAVAWAEDIAEGTITVGDASAKTPAGA